MKYINRLVYTLFLLCICAELFARNFDGTERVYINFTPDGLKEKWGNTANWAPEGSNANYAYLFNSQGGKEVRCSKLSGNLWYIVVPAGDWTGIILTRQNGSSFDWNNIYNRTQDMPIHDWLNCINNFWENGTSAEWKAYVDKDFAIPSAQKTPTALAAKYGLTIEDIHLSKSAIGYIYSLHPKLKSDKSEYDYDKVLNHAWFRYDGTDWVSLEGNVNVIRDENDRDYLNWKVTAGTSYFFLYSTDKAGMRLFSVTPDIDSELDCNIKALEYAISSVNADDNTFVLDGMIAFGKANGNLVISCAGKDTTISNATSPQTFHLRGVPADKQTHELKAEFMGDASCVSTTTVPAQDATKATYEESYNVICGEYPTTLTPKYADSNNKFVWHTQGEPDNTTTQNLVVNRTFDHDTTIVYYYTEYNPAPGEEENLMSNGDYEDTGFNYGSDGGSSSISDYTYYKNMANFYSTPAHKDKSGLFSVVQNANVFHPLFAAVEAKDKGEPNGKGGSKVGYFALFDGDASANKKAWYARTSQNPKLKLMAGTTYVISFWAANINNFGEMNNAAKLQFQISIDGGAPQDLGNEVRLENYNDNLWHQEAFTYTATANSSNIEISVVNKNDKSINVGNDFALDDIQFHAISTVSQTVKSYQKFTIVYTKRIIHYDTICVGDDYMKYGLDLQPKSSGDYRYLAGSDSVYLYVESAPKATINSSSLPHGCNDGSEIEIPFSLSGKADYYSLVFNTQDLSAVTKANLPADKKLHITIPANASAGVVTGKLTVGSELGCEQTTEFSFSIDFGGQLLRKWEDVVFVNNKDSIYTDFQWYKDGKLLSGAIGQSLYDAAGLGGHSYYCELTTRGGLKRYTCEQQFSDIQRSAELSKRNAQPREVRFYSVSGKMLYAQTLQAEEQTYRLPQEKGLYLMMLIDSDGQTITQKIIVP